MSLQQDSTQVRSLTAEGYVPAHIISVRVLMHCHKMMVALQLCASSSSILRTLKKPCITSAHLRMVCRMIYKVRKHVF